MLRSICPWKLKLGTGRQFNLQLWQRVNCRIESDCVGSRKTVQQFWLNVTQCGFKSVFDHTFMKLFKVTMKAIVY